MVMSLLFACAAPTVDDSASSAVCDTGPAPTWESFGDGFFRTYCRSCHSASTPTRSGAPESSNFDTEVEVRAQAARVRARVLEEGTMPVGGGVSEDDLILLDRLLACGL